MPNSVLCTRGIDTDLGTVFNTKIVDDRDKWESDNIAIHPVYATVRWWLTRALQKNGRAIDR
jgi:hypothetical protein